MKVKAVVSFCGKISMKIGEVKEIKDEKILNDLLNAKYVEEIAEEKKIKTIKKAVKDNED